MKSHFQLIRKRKALSLLKFIASSFFWHENRPQSSQYALEILSNIQLIAITLYSQNLFNLPASDNTLAALLRSFVRIFSYFEVFDSVNTSLNIFVFVLICLYFILILCFLVCSGIKSYKKKKIHGTYHLFITHWGQLHHTLFFWVINVFLMSTLTRTSRKITIFKLVYDSSALIVINILLIVCNYTAGIVSSAFCYDPFMTSNAFASYNSQFQMLTFLFKAIMGPVIIFVNDPGIVKWLVTIFSLLLTLIRQEFVIWDTPYYKYSAMKVTTMMASSAFSIALTNLVAAILSEFDTVTDLDILYTEIVIVALFLSFAAMRLHRTIHAYVSIPEGRLYTQRDIFRKILALNNLGDQSRLLVSSNSNRVCNRSMLYLMGDILTHEKQCYDDCACEYILKDEKKRKYKGLFEMHKTSSKVPAMIAAEILNRAIKKFKRNNFFKILLTYISLKEQNNLTASLFTLFSIDESHKTLQEDIIVCWLSKYLEEGIVRFSMEHIKNKENSQMRTANIKQIVGVEKQSDKLFTLIENNTHAYMDLWNYFIKTNISLGAFVVKSGEVEEEASKIDKVWNQISSQYNVLSPYVYGLYCTYLAIIRNMPSKAEKIYLHHIYKSKQKYSRFDDILGSINIDTSCDVILYVSMARERLGKVLYASRNIYEELGWSQSEVVDKNIKTIQPTFIKERHDQILLNHIDGAKKQPVAFRFRAVIQKKEGYSFPVNGHVTFFPYIETEPIYAGIFNKIEFPGEYIIIASNGNIESFSERVAKDLKLSVHQKINITQICPNFEETMSNYDFNIKKATQKTSHKTEKDDAILTFTPLGPGANKAVLAYTVKNETFFVLGQPFLYLYLYDQKLAYPSFDTYLDTDKKQQQQHYVNREDSLGKIPGELGEEQNTQRGDYTKRSDCMLLSSSRRNEKPTLVGSLVGSPELKNRSQADNLQSPGKKATTMQSKNTLSDLLPKEGLVTEQKRVKIKKKTFERQITLGIHPSSRSASSKERADLNDKVEQAVYKLPKQKYMRILDYLITLFGIFCISLMALNLIDSQSELSSTLEKIELMSLTFKKSVTLVLTRTRIRQLQLITKGVLSDDRFVYIGLNSWRTFIQANLKGLVITMNSYNEQIQESLNVLDESIQREIYNYEMSLQKSKLITINPNVFQIITDIANAANKVTRMDPVTITSETPEVKFILNNAVDDPLRLIERIADVIVYDCKQDLYHIRATILPLMLVTVAIWTSILFLLLVDVRSFVAKRNQFIELLLRIDEEIVQNHLKVVSRFYNYLHSSVFNPQTYLEIKRHLSAFFQVIEAKGFMKRAQYRSQKGLNVEMIKGLLLTTLSILVFASAFPVTNWAFEANMSLFMEKIDRAAEYNQQYLNSNLLFLSILEYIGEDNSTTIRNRPIEQEMMRIFELLKTAPEKFNVLVEKTKGVSDDVIEPLVKGNMCKVMSIPDYPSYYCEIIGDYIGAKGLATVLSYMIRSCEESKIIYDESNHTTKSAFAASSTAARMQGELMYIYFLRGSEMVEGVLKEDLRMSVMSYKKSIILIIVIYIIVYIILGLVLSLKFWKDMKKERANWRKIMRQIPFPILMSNKPLKAYLVNDCDHILDSFKNMI